MFAELWPRPEHKRFTITGESILLIPLSALPWLKLQEFYQMILETCIVYRQIRTFSCHFVGFKGSLRLDCIHDRILLHHRSITRKCLCFNICAKTFFSNHKKISPLDAMSFPFLKTALVKAWSFTSFSNILNFPNSVSLIVVGS